MCRRLVEGVDDDQFCLPYIESYKHFRKTIYGVKIRCTSNKTELGLITAAVSHFLVRSDETAGTKKKGGRWLPAETS